VTSQLIGDRYFCLRSGCWLDLVTGTAALVSLRNVRNGRRPHVVEHDDHRMALASSAWIDRGWQADGVWFEARPRGAPKRRSLCAGPDAVRSLVDHLVRAAVASHAGVHLARSDVPSGVDPTLVAAELARSLRREGFVTIGAGAPVPGLLRQALVHRHVAIVCRVDADIEPAVGWIRALTAASPRGHLVVDLRRWRKDPEAAPPLAVRGSWTAGRDVRLTRATRLAARRRGTAAECWLRAAIEAARRRRDDRLQTTAVCLLIARLIARDRWKTAGHIVRAALASVGDRDCRSALHEAFARIHITLGELAWADAHLAGAVTEAQLLGLDVPPVIRARQAELRFWQGRFEEAGTGLAARSASSCDELVVWRGMAAWARGDQGALAASIDYLHARGVGTGPKWVPLLEHLGHSLTGRTAIPHLVGTGSRDSPSFRRLSRACAAEALLAAGRRADARRLLGRRAGPPSEAALDEALMDRLRAASGVDPASTPTNRCHLSGLDRWGMGKTGMHLLHAVPELLHIARDSEDETAALSRGCAWVKEQAGSDGAAIMAAEPPRLVASINLSTSEVGDACRAALRSGALHVRADGPTALVASPVRYGSRTIGTTVVRGTARAVETLTEAAEALALICAPALCVRLEALASSGPASSVIPEILGQSPVIGAVREAIARAAATVFPVLIEGESGTGKELVARALHRLSPRRARRFSAVNCAALADDLVEAELFGYARGAFTGALGPRAGLFEEASGGTLLLDEVRELSARAQAKLLRALQEREVRRLGENAPRPVDVRVVAATNQPLADAVGRGAFREDLLFRLAVVRIRVPPLRDRIEDIPLLAQTFWRRLASDGSSRALLGPDAVAALCRHHWPGNVRELQNVVAGLIVLAPSRGRVGARSVARVLDGSARPDELPRMSLEAARRALERRMVATALARHAGRRAAAARELGLTRQGLAKAMRRLGLAPTPACTGVA
jgi:DNA-binding NtrC family response regulator